MCQAPFNFLYSTWYGPYCPGFNNVQQTLHFGKCIPPSKCCMDLVDVYDVLSP